MHVVVVGCGRVGSTVARHLVAEGHDVVVIDKRADSLDRLGNDFPGRTLVGVGFDRDLLARAGVTPESAVMAVTSGDNSNILIARVARENMGVDRVVARIYDPRRAIVYERLGIPTVASVAWTAARVLRHILPADQRAEWTDPTAAYVLVERKVPAGAAGRAIHTIDSAEVKVALITRLGRAAIPSPSMLLQQDDVLHLMLATGNTDRDVFASNEGAH
jgi:trk system potassium uptake protein TrkA